MELDYDTRKKIDEHFVKNGVVPPGGLKVNMFTGVIETLEPPILRVNSKGELEAQIPPSVKLGNLRDLRVKAPPRHAKAAEPSALQVNAQVNAQGVLETAAPRTVKLGNLPTQTAPKAPIQEDFPKSKEVITRTPEASSESSVETTKGPALDPFNKK